MANITKKVSCLNLFDIAEIKNSNFFEFLLNKIKLILKHHSNSFNNLYKIQILFNDFFFKIKKTDYNEDDILGNNQISLYVPFLDKSEKKTTKKDIIFLGNFPLLTNQGSFFINGIEKTLIQQTVFDPVLFFEKSINEKELMSVRGILFKNFYSNIEFVYNEKEINSNPNLFIKYKNYNTEEIPFFIFLTALNISKNLLLKILPKHKRHILNLFNNVKSLKQQEAILILLKTLDPDNLYFNEDNKIKNCFIYNSLFKIDQKTRYKLNLRFNINLPLNCLYLTKVDFILILKNIFDISDNKQDEDDIDCYSNKALLDFTKFFEEILLSNFEDELTNKKKNKEKKNELNNNNNNKLFENFSQKTSKQIDEFFSTSDTSLVKEDTNPLTIISQKKKILTLKKQEGEQTVPLETRDIHKSMFGKICVIETPEGQSSGLIANLTGISLTNLFGFIETPYFTVFSNKIILFEKMSYSISEDDFISKILFSNSSFDKNKELKQRLNYILKNKGIKTNKKKSNSFYKNPISFLQFFSVACCTIPFLEHNDGNRILMGANMQRQALSLLFAQNPIVATGFENILAHSFTGSIKSFSTGLVSFVDLTKIQVKTKTNKNIIYYLNWFDTTSNDIVIREKPNVSIGEKILFGQIIADSCSIEQGELSLGTNLNVAYLSWDGFNFEDSIIINEGLVKENRLTSLHVKKFEIELEKNYFFNTTLVESNYKNLDQFGLIRRGSFVNKNDVLFVKQSDSLDELIYTNDTGIIVDIKIETDYLINNINYLIDNNIQDKKITEKNIKLNIYLLQLNKIRVGDKLSGRFGNKGVISKIVPSSDMPKLIDGSPVDILLNPLGIPSRMNLGQIYEGLLGFSGNILNKNYKIQSFDEKFHQEASNILISQKFKEISLKHKKKFLVNINNNGKTYLKDGRTGEFFDNPIFVSTSYILKLFHLVNEKIASRTEGPSSLITLQPLRGKTVRGGQRFGEMEIWAIEAYGASFTIQDILITKSDDILLHNNINKLIEENKLILDTTLSQTNLLLTYDLKALGLNLTYNSFDIYNDNVSLNDIEKNIYINEINLKLNPDLEEEQI